MGRFLHTVINGGESRCHLIPIHCALLLIAAWSAEAAAPRTTIDLRHPPADVLILSADAGTLDLLATSPPHVNHDQEFIGDVDGDGYDDFALAYWNPKGGDGATRDALLVYGGPRIPFGTEKPFEDLRATRIVGAWRDSPYGGFDAVGDVDHDGFADFLLGSLWTAWNGIGQGGAAYLFFGGPSLPAQISLPDLSITAIRFIRFAGDEEDMYAGTAVAAAGDVNGDGEPDFAIGANGVGTENGGAHAGKLILVYGGQDFDRTVLLSDVGANVGGLIIRGALGQVEDFGHHDELGRSVTRAGDMNGDGYDDLAVGAEGVEGGRGAVYLLLGGPHLAGVKELRTANLGFPLIEIRGPAGAGYFGNCVKGGADVDGDGLSDLVIVGNFGNFAYVVFGQRQWEPSVAVDGGDVRVFRLDGPKEVDVVGNHATIGTASCIGDWNGDGFGDFVVAASSQSLRFCGRVGEGYLVYGGPHLEGSANVADVGTDRVPGMVIKGKDANAYLGRYLSRGGDFDGDGAPDFLMATSHGWPYRMTPQPERNDLYLFFGASGVVENLQAVGVEPHEGLMEGNEEVAIIGSGFRGGESVRFGGKIVSRVTALNSAELRVVTPAETAAGPVDIEVLGDGGRSAVLRGGFTYFDDPYPDLVLDPDALREKGYRVFVYNDTPLNGDVLNVCAADLNFDGMDELIIGEPGWDDWRAGRVAVLPGRTSWPDEIGPGETLDHGVVIVPGADNVGLGSEIHAGQDFDRDGLQDLVIGWLQKAGATTASTYVLLGVNAERREEIDLSAAFAEGRAVEIRKGTCGQHYAVLPGDVNDDGLPDVVTAYPLGNCGGIGELDFFLDGIEPGGSPSLSWMVQGDPVTKGLPQFMTAADDPRSFAAHASAAGDWNGDGVPDIVIGAYDWWGACYVLLGGALSFLDAHIGELVDAGQAIIILDEQIVTAFGCSLAGLGDFDGDGYDDIAAGAWSGGRNEQGAVHVVYGNPEYGAETTELHFGSAAPDRVLTITGENGSDHAGYVTALGDINGDGLADLGITGEYHWNKMSRAYVVLGSSSRPSSFDLSYLGKRGFRIQSLEGNSLSKPGLLQPGGAMAGGDFNGDGLRDLVLAETTRAVIIFGRMPTGGLAPFRRGDSNGDGDVNVADAIYALSFLFASGKSPTCLDAADANDSGGIDIADAITILSHLFAGSGDLPEPFGQCGIDPTIDDLDCVTYPPCAQ